MPRYTVSSFPPEFLALYLRATTTTFTFPMTFNEAVNRRMHFHSLRAAMRREGHAAADVVGVVMIGIKPARKMEGGDGTEPAVLTFRPRGDSFTRMIQAVMDGTGVEVGGLTASLNPTPSTPSPSELPAVEDDYFQRLLDTEGDDDL